MYISSLDKEDYLRFFLFTASMSGKVRSQRRRTWFLFLLGFLYLGYETYTNEGFEAGKYFVILSGLFLVGYPFFSAWRYKRFYTKHIEANYGGLVGKPVEIHLEDDGLVSKDDSGESKVLYSEMEVIYEIRENLFIQRKDGKATIVPARMEGYEAFKEALSEKTMELDWFEYLQWKWR